MLQLTRWSTGGTHTMGTRWVVLFILWGIPMLRFTGACISSREIIATTGIIVAMMITAVVGDKSFGGELQTAGREITIDPPLFFVRLIVLLSIYEKRI